MFSVVSFSLRPRKIISLCALAMCLGAPIAQAEGELPTGDVDAGATIYNNVCKGCHGVSIAPTLRGIIDRPIASIRSFYGYTDALKAKQGMQWSIENLDTFLTNPSDFAPGTDMVQIIADPQERADIIAFLKALPPPRK